MKANMTRYTTCFLVALPVLFLISLTQATARPEPAIPRENQIEGVEEANPESEVNGGCEGVGEDECLMRRTLAAHIDYIYTQGKHN